MEKSSCLPLPVKRLRRIDRGRRRDATVTRAPIKSAKVKKNLLNAPFDKTTCNDAAAAAADKRNAIYIILYIIIRVPIGINDSTGIIFAERSIDASAFALTLNNELNMTKRFDPR